MMQIEWEEWPPLPLSSSEKDQPGLAGAFIGKLEDALILAGGANFPALPPWKNGEKVYHDEIYILTNSSDSLHWNVSSTRLPNPSAYGLSITLPDAILCIGGMNNQAYQNNVFKIILKQDRKTVVFEELPSLPEPVANMSGGLLGNQVYVAASSEQGQRYFWRYNLDTPGQKWESLKPWPGPPVSYAYGAVQHDGNNLCFYLLKGRYPGEDGMASNNLEGYVYNPLSEKWQTLNWNNSLANDLGLSAGTVLPYGANHLLLFGGSDGVVHELLEELNIRISRLSDPIQQNKLVLQLDSIQIHHPGFSSEIYAFHTITQTLVKMGNLPDPVQVTTTAVKWNDQIIIPSGEIRPGIRTPKIRSGKIKQKASFGSLNYLVLTIYLSSLVLLGFYFAKKQHSTLDFFKGGHRIPGWAAGVSIFGTQLSAITFMAIPAKTFATDWTYFFLLMTIIMVMPFIIRYFLPFYRRFDLTTAYEYLELRFNYPTRAAGSTMYILMQIGRLGIVLLLPSLALSVVSGINIYACILCMGVLSIIYTALGGIEAVIWTDVMQVVVLLGGALLSLVLLYYNQNSPDIASTLGEFNKLKIFDFNLSFRDPTIWVVILGGFATNLIQYGSDQTVVQRYLTTKNEKSAAQSIRIGAWMTLPSALIFFTLGSLLFSYYRENPLLLSPALEKTDNIFPWFIMHGLPNGVSGLLIAAIFAASMSSLDSSMNSVATVVTTDFYRRWKRNLTERQSLRAARWITSMTGLIGTFLALSMAQWGISSLWDQFNLVVGLFAGGLGGIFLLGIFTSRTTGTGALTGLVVSGLTQYFIKEYTQVHLLLYAFTGMAVAIAVGYFTSFLTTRTDHDSLRYTYSYIKNNQ
ncbi:MAG: sodium/solute symporter [Saprospiraceae bacterium]|nr:sodium/solute symporter [Saprospiraceae bacterium]